MGMSKGPLSDDHWDTAQTLTLMGPEPMDLYTSVYMCWVVCK